MTLQEAFDRQFDLETRVYGHPLPTMRLSERVAFITVNTIAATDEAHEALNETSWKPWAEGDWINEEAFKSELVDEFHFFMNRCLVVEMTAEELLQRYFAKADKNERRQLEGYDGKNKCYKCKRALDDSHVHESIDYPGWCVACVTADDQPALI